MQKTNKWVRSSYVFAYAYDYVAAVFTCASACARSRACAYALVKTSKKQYVGLEIYNRSTFFVHLQGR